jgi:signal transduction histidine kinase
MAARFASHPTMTEDPESLSGMRPITLLIATGIALITATLMVIGIAANHLREQALRTAGSELARIDSVLAAASTASLDVITSRLTDLAARLEQNAAADPANLRAAAMPETAAWLHDQLGRVPRLDAIAILAANGEVLGSVGAWPRDQAVERAAVAIAADSAPTRALGPAIRDPQTGATGVPVMQRLEGPAGKPLGAVVAIVPLADFTSLFAAVPLPADAVITLLGANGAELARYPGAGADSPTDQTDLAAVFADPAATALRQVSAENGGWRMQAVRAMAGFPAAVAISRDAGAVLAEWNHQILWLSAFALFAAVVIGVMIYLIARQFKTHADLAAMRADRIEAEKIESERARLAAETELLKSERLSVLGQLTATVAHELRNPLSAIRNTLFTVKELATNSGVKLDRPIARMERSIERCDRIISDLLEYTRNRELNRTDLRVDRWLADMLAEQTIRAPIVLSTEFCAPGSVVPADADRLRRVVINLVENAAQALAETPADREKRVTVRTTVAHGELVLTVEDTGPGIPPENLSRIFEPLFSTKSFGTGLGLPTVKQIVNQHDGIISVDSEVGRGTCVTVRLPLRAEEKALELKEAA